MWYPYKVITPPTEPLTKEEAKRQCNVFHDDDDALFDSFVAVARDHVERYCGTPFGTQSIEVNCDSFCDFSKLPFVPLQTVTSIEYVDTAGTAQTLPTSVYEARSDALDASIIKKYGQVWPPVQAGSRIKVTATVGYSALPPSVRHAMLLWIAEAYEQRESAAAPGMTTFDVLLCNYRRN